ncbi:SDR family NAD(P)-dependent oxidoreductase [Microbacterium sp. NPDC056569]|uniref:SDR family NAD(P)-dependent oxidoreductase n=1 Tax=Microbacterium sp. NPDC056569 TaxID=3345867 RepID=UPI00366B5700
MSTNPKYDFTGQVALVTGGASGMGLAAARAFAENGAAVALVDYDRDAVERAAQALTDAGHRAVGLVADVADEAQVAAAVDQAVETFGRLDMAFNNAGVQAPPSDAADETAENFDRVNAVNLRGVWAAQKHELRHMRAQGSGAIVNNSSLGGLVGLPERAAYHASKHGVIGLTKSAAVEYAPRGIRINAICPGVVETPMVAGMLEGQAEAMAAIMQEQPIGRLGTADEIAAAVLWLCSSASSFVVGVALPVDGGFTTH